jgi:hypothetical protein
MNFIFLFVFPESEIEFCNIILLELHILGGKILQKKGPLQSVIDKKGIEQDWGGRAGLSEASTIDI